jgi:hypothetical protein
LVWSPIFSGLVLNFSGLPLLLLLRFYICAALSGYFHHFAAGKATEKPAADRAKDRMRRSSYYKIFIFARGEALFLASQRGVTAKQAFRRTSLILQNSPAVN